MAAGIHQVDMPKRLNHPVHGPTGMISRDGAVLMEVVLALALFAAAAAVIGSGLNASSRSLDRLRFTTHASDLAESVLSEIQLGLKPLAEAGPENFDPPFQDWTWQLAVTPAGDSPFARTQLQHVEVIVRNQQSAAGFRLSQLLSSVQNASGAGPIVPGAAEALDTSGSTFPF